MPVNRCGHLFGGNLDRMAQGKREPGATIWLTGLPAAGKSTIASAVAARLAEAGREVEVLDGDEFRLTLSAGLGFSRDDRDVHVQRVGYVAEMLARHGVLVIVPVIAPYRKAREIVRRRHKRRGTNYLEIHVSTPVVECARRDPKGLYAKAFAGVVTGLTGVDDPYEQPLEPDLRLNTSQVDVDTAGASVMRLLASRNLV